MSSINFDLNFNRLARAIGETPQRLRREMARTMPRVLALFGREAKRQAAKAFSILTNAIREDVVSPFEGEIIAGTNYAQAVEEGTGVHGPAGQASGKMPPVGAIEDWIKVRKIVPNQPGMDSRDLAFVIARSIANNGTPAQPFMEPALESQAEKASRLLNNAIERALEAA